MRAWQSACVSTDHSVDFAFLDLMNGRIIILFVEIYPSKYSLRSRGVVPSVSEEMNTLFMGELTNKQNKASIISRPIVILYNTENNYAW